MSIVIMVGQLLLGLSILVILHELGHFLAARAFGIKVDKFYLFFDAWGVSLFKFNYKGVEYGVGWLPLGGYVKIAGMIDESMDKEQMAGPPQPWEFRSKPAWQRLIVMMGGIIVNIFVGIFIFWMLTMKYGDAYIPVSEAQYGIVAGPVGQKIGLRSGDQIVGVNGKAVTRFDDIVNPKVLLDNAVLNIQRGNQKLDITVPDYVLDEMNKNIESFVSMLPRTKFAVDSVVAGGGAAKAGLMHGDSILAINGNQTAFFDQLEDQLIKDKNSIITLSVKRNGSMLTLPAQVNANGKLLFSTMNGLKPYHETYGFFQSLPVGASKAWGYFVNNAKGLRKMVTGRLSTTNISSPVGIAKLYGGEFDWYNFWRLTAFISMALALMNLLPIPALDGGHALFLIVEMIKGKPLSDKFLERAQIVGFVIVICLMVFAFSNDILKGFHK